MAIIYTWAVTAVKTKTEAGRTNAIVQTYWEKIGTDDNGNTGKFAGATPFTVDPDAENFIPFEQLTEKTVLSWIKAVVIGDYEHHVNAVIQKQIDEIANPVTDATLPWATN